MQKLVHDQEGIVSNFNFGYFYHGLSCHPELDSGSTQIPDQVRNDILGYRLEILSLIFESEFFRL